MTGPAMRAVTGATPDVERVTLGPAAASAVAMAAVALLTALAALTGERFPDVFFPIVGVVAIAALRWPYLGLAAALVITPTFGWVVVGPSISAFQVLLPATALGALIAYRRDVRPLAARLLRQRSVVLAMAFLAVVCVAALVRWGSGDAAYVRNYAGALVLLIVAAVLLRSPDRRVVLVAVTVTACAANAIVGLAQLFTSDALVSAWVLESNRVFSETYERFAAPWGLGAVAFNFAKDVLVGFLLALPFLARGQEALGRRLLPAAVLVLGLALFVSGGRSDWLGGVIALAYVAVVMREHRLLAAGSAGMIVVLLVCLVRPLTPVDVQAAVGLGARDAGGGVASAPAAPAAAGARDEVSVEMSNNVRERLTKGGFGMIGDHPVFGVGPGAFREYIDRYEPIRAGELTDPRPRLPAHNVFLELWAGSGTPAFLLYVGFLGAALLALERRRRASQGLDRLTAVAVTAALIGLNVTSAFHNYQTENFLWALLGLAVSLELGWRVRDRLAGADAPVASRPVAERVAT